MWFSRREGPQIEALKAEIRDLDGRVKALETEWATVYARVKRAVGHLTKTEALALPPQKVDVPTIGAQNGTRSIDQLTRDEIARLPLP